MNIFVSGGCKNGKSMFAQEVARNMAEKSGEKLFYIATMIPGDAEDEARIERHKREREGWGFETIEVGRDIMDITKNLKEGKGVFLLDSVTALLSNEMFLPKGEVNKMAGEKVTRDLCQLMDHLGSIVFVSDYIYSDARRFDEFTNMYRRALALCGQTLAKKCDQVVEVAYGMKYFYKEAEVDL